MRGDKHDSLLVRHNGELFTLTEVPEPKTPDGRTAKVKIVDHSIEIMASVPLNERASLIAEAFDHEPGTYVWEIVPVEAPVAV